MVWALTIAATLGTGMMAGLFFIFSATIMTALGRLPPSSGISAMQSINVVILNPWFFLVFFGTAAASLVLGIVALLDMRAAGSSAMMVAAALLYLVGGIAVTIICNVPLNDRLAIVEPGSEQAVTVWAHYLDVWTKWNHVRTMSCLASAVLFTIATAQRWSAV